MIPNLTDTIAEVRTLTARGEYNRDMFTIENNKLVPSNGGFSEALILSVKDMVYGGHNRRDVDRKITEIFGQTRAMVQEIGRWDIQKKQEHFAELKELSRELKLAANILTSPLKSQRDILKRALKDVPVPEGYRRPGFDLSRPWRWQHIKLQTHIKKGQSVEEFLQIAGEVKRRKVPDWQRLSVKVFSLIGKLTGLLPFAYLSWNPEGYRHGEDRSPLVWFWENMESLERRYEPPTGKLLTEMGQNVLMNPDIKGSFLDERRIKAFESLANDVIELDLSMIQLVKTGDSVDEDKIGITKEQLLRIIEKLADDKTKRHSLILPQLPEEEEQIPHRLKELGFKK